MRNKSSRGMASGDVGKLTFAAVAIIAAIVFIVFYFQRQHGHEVGRGNVAPGSSPKVQAMKAMKSGGNSQASGRAFSLGPNGSAPGSTVGNPAGGSAAQDNREVNPDSHGGN